MAETHKPLTLSLYSPERKVLERLPVKSVTLTTSEGQIQVLPGHIDFVGLLQPGLFAYVPESGEANRGFISYGFFDVTDGNLSVMAEVLELADEISLERAQSAADKARAKLSSQETSLEELEKFQMKLQRAMLRQSIASKIAH